LSYLNGSDSNSAQPLSAPLKPAFSPSGCQSRAEGEIEYGVATQQLKILSHLP
jgi:hypothetical protein